MRHLHCAKRHWWAQILYLKKNNKIKDKVRIWSLGVYVGSGATQTRVLKYQTALCLKRPNITAQCLSSPSGSVPGAGVLPEAGSSAAVPREMPEGKEPRASTAAAAACRGGGQRLTGTPVPRKPQTWMSPVLLSVHLLYQTCLFNWYQQSVSEQHWDKECRLEMFLNLCGNQFFYRINFQMLKCLNKCVCMREHLSCCLSYSANLEVFRSRFILQVYIFLTIHSKKTALFKPK